LSFLEDLSFFPELSVGRSFAIVWAIRGRRERAGLEDAREAK
jgi:hypothetical protein